MPERLEEEMVADALVALPAWSGDSATISRSVTASGSSAEELIDRVNETAESMNHQPGLERGDDTVTVTLATESVGGVTSVDIAMASVIEDLVAATTGEPAQHAHHEVSLEQSDPDVTPGDPLEPMIGARSGGAGGPAVLLPSDEPGHSEPGIAPEQLPAAPNASTDREADQEPS
jgi:4a-hydroxytetrahydrobiopterin dehydratase